MATINISKETKKSIELDNKNNEEITIVKSINNKINVKQI